MAAACASVTSHSQGRADTWRQTGASLAGPGHGDHGAVWCRPGPPCVRSTSSPLSSLVPVPMTGTTNTRRKKRTFQVQLQTVSTTISSVVHCNSWRRPSRWQAHNIWKCSQTVFLYYLQMKPLHQSIALAGWSFTCNNNTHLTWSWLHHLLICFCGTFFWFNYQNDIRYYSCHLLEQICG